MPMLSTWPKLQSGRYDRTIWSFDTATARTIAPGARFARPGSPGAETPAPCTLVDDLGRSSSGARGRGDAGSASGLGSGLAAGASALSVGRPSPAVAATVRPS